ncbi:HalOD1 output domain-containing protein [Natronococcus wangiae]|uniref:HalOD1 output domain-containing protein n=1 Tax=Natronococcus wangiae TaxID=3068275 RepID=UPI00273DE751|nr:HalOD1 output domain-containing protein [Natronococcus sp. AD5]
MTPNVSYTSNENNSHAPAASSERYVTSYDRNGTAKLSTVLVHALADLMDVDIREVEKALYESIDPESLDHLFQRTPNGTARPGGHLTFTVKDYLVMISDDGRIEITSREYLSRE